MSEEIKYPAQRTYWVARDADGNVLLAGYTEPNQVTTSGQSVLTSGSRAVQVEEIAQFRGNPEAWNYEWNGSEWVFEGDAIYIAASTEIAEPLSRSLFNLIYGNENGLYASVITHPTRTNESVLICRSVDVIPLALAADPQPLVDVLQIAVNNGSITQQEVDSIANAIAAMAGQEVKLIDFVPPSWQQYVYTKEQLEADGWFLDETINQDI